MLELLMDGFDKKAWFNFFVQATQSEEGFKRLGDAGYFFVDKTLGVLMSSTLMVQMGLGGGVTSMDAFCDYLHEDDVQSYTNLWARVEQGWEDTFLTEYRFRTPSGEYRWFRTEIFVLNRREDGTVAQYLGRDRDIHKTKESEALLLERLAEAENRLLQIESLRVAGMVLSTATDLASTVELVLEQASSLLPYSKASLFQVSDQGLVLLSGLEETPEDKSPVGIKDFQPVSKVTENLVPHIVDDLADLSPPYQGDTQHRYHSWMGIPLVHRRQLMGILAFWHREKGMYRSEQIWPLMGFGETVALAMANAQTIQNLRKDAQTDHLTELGTRRVLDSSAPTMLRDASRHKRSLALILLDLDHFKLVNDQYGHLTGDRVLRGVGDLLRANLRASDLICRFGGEEFVAILPRTPAAVARQVVERLRLALASTTFGGLPQPVTASFGLVLLRSGVKASLDGLLAKADEAMYQAKARGRNCIVETIFGT